MKWEILKSLQMIFLVIKAKFRQSKTIVFSFLNLLKSLKNLYLY